MEENTEPESFIVQNVTMGPHYVSDIRLNFGPLEAIDLTWEDAKVIKASKDLRSSLRMGFLKKISPNQFDTIEEKAAIRGKKELLRQQNDNNLRTVDVDGKQLEVESIDAEKAYKKENEVSTAGYANDSLSYATAFDIAQTQAELRGDELSIEEFAEQVNNNLTQKIGGDEYIYRYIAENRPSIYILTPCYGGMCNTVYVTCLLKTKELFESKPEILISSPVLCEIFFHSSFIFFPC
jgi:hypothetical protein